MTLRITCQNSTATTPLRWLKRFAPPVAMDFFTFTQDDLSRALINVGTGADATQVGSPSVNSVAATFVDGKYIDTGVLETASMTLCAVVQRNAAQVYFMGTHDNADTNYIGLFTNGSSPRKPVFQAKATSGNAVVSTSSDWSIQPLEYEVIFGKVNAVGLTTSLYIPRTGERVTGVITGTRGLSGRTVKIGAGPNPPAIYAGDTTLGKAYGVAARHLSNAEEDQMYEYIQRRIAGV